MKIEPRFTQEEKSYLLHALCLELEDVEDEYKEDVKALIHTISRMDVKEQK